MNTNIHTQLRLREVFHLEFLRWLSRKIKVKYFALKGGTNLRFFFNSFRYSEDMDLDLHNVEVRRLKDVVMKIFQSPSFHDSLTPFGIERIIPPDITKAKQTETTQRFKVHLMTPAGEDLFTKVEFSRRGFKGRVVVQFVPEIILRAYKLPPLIVPHYDIQSAITQKIAALAKRTETQARDVFDTYVLSSQYTPPEIKEIKINESTLTKACERVFEVSFQQFCDTIVPYLAPEDQPTYNSSSLWDEIKLKVANFIEELRR